MTLAETVLMISLGTLLIQPVVSKNIWTTIGVGVILVLTLIILEYIQMKSDPLEQMITGKSKILIENGEINEKNLMKLRISVDQLEMNLRQKNVTNISDVEWATLEHNGQVGFTLKESAQPVTKKEFQQLQQSINSLLNKQLVNNQSPVPINDQSQRNEKNLFEEVKQQEHKFSTPKHLQ